MGKKQVAQKTKEEVAEEAKRIETKRAERTSKTAGSKKISKGKIYIKVSYNNTFITVTDIKGNVIAWMTAGSLGFSGPKKSTPFAASRVAEAIAEKLRRTGPFDVEVYIRGIGGGRGSAIRTLASRGFNISMIKDITPIPHNGPRAKKPRRV